MSAQQLSKASTVSATSTPSEKGCEVITLQETKRDGTSEIFAAVYRVYFSGDCSGVKGRKGQHGVGPAVKKEIVKKIW